MHYLTLLFDLDGTISDPKIGITNSVRHALSRFNISVQDPDSLVDFIGPPLHESFKTKYAMDNSEAKRAVRYFREYFSRYGLYENRLYPGIESLLCELKEEGRLIILATTKPEVFARRILRHFRLDALFSGVFGSNLDGSGASKAELIGRILEHGQGISGKTSVMIGDRALDILGARAHGIDSIGVTYGYGTKDEIEGSHPTRVARSVNELKTLLQTGLELTT
jgi:phosphoglycolate phosphatase